ncbi:MAG: selenium cofactor biosynthesis protein YqeC [Spirochaetia bacterium]
MSTSAQRFREALARWFLPGAVYTFVGAGGKTAALKRVADFMVETGVKARLTTTTRVGIAEFDGVSVDVIHGPDEMAEALGDETPIRLLVGGTLPAQGKYRGLEQRMIERASVRADTIVLVEGDGSRKRPMKAPEIREPVIPANSAAVFALMGAAAFDEPIDEAHCYNHQKALALVGKTGSFFEPREIAALAADPEGCCKGVLAGMAFRLLINQGDIEEKRGTAVAALRLARERYGITGALVSLQKGELYDTTEG